MKKTLGVIIKWWLILACIYVIITTFGCKSKSGHLQPEYENFIMTFKYTVGDVVYLKPDSTKALITKVNATCYSIHRGSKQSSLFLTVVGEEAIYGKEMR